MNLPTLPDDEFGRTPADVDGKDGFLEDREELEDAEVNQAGLLLAGEDFDIEAEVRADDREEVGAVGGVADGGGGNEAGRAVEGEGAEGGVE